MGMAASQARYLGLSARKTNVEYEGQQINQARTALANQSADYYNEMLALQVPIAPDPTSFESSSYVFEDGITEYTLSNYVQNTNGNPDYPYTVTLTYKTEQYAPNKKPVAGVVIGTNSDTQTNTDYPYTIMTSTGLQKLRLVDFNAAQGDPGYPNDTDTIAVNKIKEEYKNLDTTTRFYCYEENGVPIYISEADLNAYKTGNYDPNAKLDTYFATNQEVTKTEEYEAAIVFDPTLRHPTSIRINDGSVDGKVHNVKIATNQDEAAYNQAMNAYTYDRMTYDKAIEDINAKTEKVQEQDRMLELRLKQLDTEQNALQTEMDAVSKVIEKNIEQTFKTFG